MMERPGDSIRGKGVMQSGVDGGWASEREVSLTWAAPCAPRCASADIGSSPRAGRGPAASRPSRRRRAVRGAFRCRRDSLERPAAGPHPTGPRACSRRRKTMRGRRRSFPPPWGVGEDGTVQASSTRRLPLHGLRSGSECGRDGQVLTSSDAGDRRRIPAWTLLARPAPARLRPLGCLAGTPVPACPSSWKPFGGELGGRERGVEPGEWEKPSRRRRGGARDRPTAGGVVEQFLSNNTFQAGADRRHPGRPGSPGRRDRPREGWYDFGTSTAEVGRVTRSGPPARGRGAAHQR